MKRLASLLLLGTLQTLLACSHTDPKAATQLTPAPPSASPKEDAASTPTTHYPKPDELLKDFMTWYSYTYYNIHLAQDFIGLNADSVAVSKATFLRSLATGKFIPLQVASQHSVPAYKLWQLTSRHDDITQVIKQLAATEQDNYSREGKLLPAYHFTDLTGKNYTPASTKGKIMVLKCWFIACGACVKEFPELNRLVDEYEDRKDVLFVSLATDAKSDLAKFITKKPFSYAVVPEQTDYLQQQLKVNIYPTHFLLDRKGRIVKVSSSISDLKPFIAQQLALAAH
jgi:peroxiredoxin